MPRRRLDADSLRDTILAVAGTLNLKMGGVGVIPPLTREEILAARFPNLWPANPDPGRAQSPQRLSADEALVDAAPAADLRRARHRHELPAPRTLHRRAAGAGADERRIHASRRRTSSPRASRSWRATIRRREVETGWKLAFGRTPTATERQTALDFLQRNSLPRLCLLIFNMSEFIYVD